jgi:hypothetical protein
MKNYIFFRLEGFYPAKYKNDAEAIKGALANNGTLRVETVSGRLVWKLELH